MRPFALAAVAVLLVLAVAAAAALGTTAAGALVGAAGAILAGLGGWQVLRLAKERLASGVVLDPGDRAQMVAVRVLYVIVAGAIVIASLRAARS
ncbi:MAG: hypothetical protein K8T90_15500 [Planctomycetes bacterium]|nr:hypothetical protein [Planctomycetota bacterium]